MKSGMLLLLTSEKILLFFHLVGMYYSCAMLNCNLSESFHYRHGIKLRFDDESLLNGRHMFQVQNYLQGSRKQKEKGLKFLLLICYILIPSF
jgi:hypothetical protein